MSTRRPRLTFAPPATPFLASSPASAGRSAAALFGAPLDLTESFRSGTHGGPGAVRRMSEGLESFSPTLGRDLADASLLDLGDVPLEGAAMEPALAAIADAMERAASLARLAVMLGGEHTASLAGYRGIKRAHPDARLLHVDAHLDFREQYAGQRLSHASWLRRAGEEFDFQDLFLLGIRSADRDEWRAARERAAWSSPDLALPAAPRRALAGRPVYLTIDIDVLDPAYAPGTGCPEPGGASFRELAAFLYSLAGLRVVGLDVMEVSPNLDPAEITAAAAAKLVREAVLLF